MKKIIPLILIAIISISVWSCKRKPAPLTEEEAVSIIKRFDEGWVQKNLVIVDSVLAPNYIYFTQSGGLFSRDSVVQTAGSESYSLSFMERTAFSVSLDDNVGIVSTRWKGVGVYRGRPFNEDQRCSITIIKRNGRVQILSEHCTPIKQMPIFH